MASYTDATGRWEYYLLGNNFSVVGTGNADGSLIQAIDYGSGGDFTGSGAMWAPADFDHDGDIDRSDFMAFQGCITGEGAGPPAMGCEDKDLDHDTDVDQEDFGEFQGCFSGSYMPIAPACMGTALPASGTFTMHGLMIDVLPDGKALLYARARHYDMKHGRWLQRDPLGFIDGPNLYEAFGGNAIVHVDPMGEQVYLPNGYLADEYVRAHRESSTFGRPPSDPEEVKDLAKTAAVSTLNVVPYAFGIVPGIIVNVVTLSMVAPTAYYARDAQFVATTGEHLAADQAIAIVFFDLTQISTGSMILTGEDFLTVQGVDPTTREKAATHLAVGLICGLGTAKSLSPVRGGVYGAEPVLLDTMARVAPNSPKVQSFFLRQALEIGARDYAARTPGVAHLVAAQLSSPKAGTRPTQLAMNIAAGQYQEIAAQAWAAAQGETLLQTQFRQGAVLRGIDFASFITTPEGGVQLFLNEVSSTQGLRAPGTYTALGMGRGGQAVFGKNLLRVQEAIETQVAQGPLREALLAEAQSGGTIRLIGPSGFGVTSQGSTRIQTATNRPVVVVIVPSAAP